MEQKKKILIVDDDVQTLDMYVKVFRNAGFEVAEATDGLEGLDKATKNVPAVIFTGIVMPRMDGFTMMQALKKNASTANIPVVINSHLGRKEDQERADDLGAKDFIVRDYTPPRETVERVSALLLGGEFAIDFDENAFDAPKLAKEMGTQGFYCSNNKKMILKLRVDDPKQKKFSAWFVCE